MHNNRLILMILCALSVITARCEVQQEIGRLSLFMGSMYGGKSFELIRCLQKDQQAGKKCIAISHSLSTHARAQMSLASRACGGIEMACHVVNDARCIPALCEQADSIGIDEAQCFDHSLVEIVQKMLLKGKHVYVGGLSVNGCGEAFEVNGPNPILSLVPQASRVEVCPSVCSYCGDDASNHLRIFGGEIIKHDGYIPADPEIDREYRAACKECFAKRFHNIDTAKKVSCHGGSLTFITGPMQAGKSCETLKMITNVRHKKKSLIAFSCKNPGDPVIKSRALSYSEPCLIIKGPEDFASIIDTCTPFDYVFFDEVHFFGEDFSKILNQLRNSGKHVVAAGLNRDCCGGAFQGCVPTIAASANKVITLEGVCYKCKRPASVIQRLINGKPFNKPNLIMHEHNRGRNAESGLTEIIYESCCEGCRIEYSTQPYDEELESLSEKFALKKIKEDPSAEEKTEPNGYGDLTIICGPLCAGKTTRAIHMLDRHTISGKTSLVFRNANTRDGGIGALHARNGQSCEGIILGSNDIEEMKAIVRQKKPNVVIIDEAQFFSKDLCSAVTEFRECGVDVICIGLDIDVSTEPFPGPISHLCTTATKVIKLQAVCIHCKDDASFMNRYVLHPKTEKWIAFNEKDLLIFPSPTTKYEPVCKKCYIPYKGPHVYQSNWESIFESGYPSYA